MIDRFKFRLYVNQNDEYPEKKGYVNTEDFYVHPDGDIGFFNADYDFAEYIIEQCTGARDTKGKLVYENDIVKNHRGEIGLVEWYEGTCQFFIVDVENKEAIDILDDICNYEVIGNIHEKPELLGKK